MLEKKRLQKEELRLQIISKVTNALNKLYQKIFFREAYIFGSLTKSHRFTGYSDIDIGFFGLRDEDFFKALAFLSGELASDIDIIQLEGHKFKDKIIREGIRWTKKD